MNEALIRRPRQTTSGCKAGRGRTGIFGIMDIALNQSLHTYVLLNCLRERERESSLKRFPCRRSGGRGCKWLDYHKRSKAGKRPPTKRWCPCEDTSLFLLHLLISSPPLFFPFSFLFFSSVVSRKASVLTGEEEKEARWEPR